MHFGHLLFKTNGRIGRGVWWLTQIGLLVFLGLSAWLWHQFGFHDAIFGFIGTVLMFWIRVSINVKRLHDVGLSGWWLVLFESFPILGVFAFGVGVPYLISGLIGVLGYATGFVILGFMRGSKDENKHGEAL